MKNKVVAGILAILLGDLGIHKFYLGKIGWGIVYLLFCWTGIPAIVGMIEGIIYLCTDDETFQVKYCGMPPSIAVKESSGEYDKIDDTPIEDNITDDIDANQDDTNMI